METAKVNVHADGRDHQVFNTFVMLRNFVPSWQLLFHQSKLNHYRVRCRADIPGG